MPSYPFVTLDVFTERRFGGNPLAVFPDAGGLDAGQMQALAKEFNLSETTFVLPPADPANTARVRIFTPQREMPFAGHPNVGTAWALAAEGRDRDGVLRFEEPAGLVEVAVERRDGVVIGCSVAAPQPLTRRASPAAATVAACTSLSADEVSEVHAASVGAAFVCASVSLEALDRARPDLGAFQAAAEASPDGGFALFLYARENATRLNVRMFAPAFGVVEDPATGSAAAALGALLLDLSGEAEAIFEMHQGAQMGRPSLMQVRAHRTGDGVRAFVGGACVSVLRGEAQV